MLVCSSCSSVLAEGARFCSSCGASASPSSQAPTRLGAPAGGVSPAGSPAPSPRASWPGGATPIEGRFLPGNVLAGRYRIAGLLGRGGMAEVYRADDLKLGQPVALKFLPEAFASDPARLERLYNEVRLARQVSHPNVCRVYDVGEIDSHRFLSMEYVDGEDLASLLRRIGRLPGDKAVEIARQICAGLAAAHDRGVLHRDLKPGNVMIDGRGRARITDFGLAAISGEVEGTEVRAGTPTYMAPEQLAGREVTVRSDIYALGLILYEVVTGRPAFEAKSLEELNRLHTETTPLTPSSRVQDLDPAVERVILRCLEKDPRDRPSSALAVAAALPGGDPLAAALAAGETPSPEMVAAAGDVGALRPLAAIALLAVVVAGLGSLAFFTDRVTLPGRVGLPKPPAVLEERAREIFREIGYEEPAADREYGFGTDADFVNWAQRHDPSPGRWSNLSAQEPPAIVFWYRESPRHLDTLNTIGIVLWDDPPHEISGMRAVQMDPQGRITHLLAVPPQVEKDVQGRGDPDWDVLFKGAGLDRGGFRAVPPSRTPPFFADVRAAWEGAYPSRPGVTLRVEAAAYRGRPVYFEVIGPWTRAERMQRFEQPKGLQIALLINAILIVGVLAGAVFLARRNLRLGRGDRRGAFRIALFMFGLAFLSVALQANHGPTIAEEFRLFVMWTARSLFLAGIVWLLYLALEPIVRRRWPDSIISWNRLLAGRLRDPLVGRDILIGSAAGGFTAGALLAARLALDLYGGTHLAPAVLPVGSLLGAGGVFVDLAQNLMNGLISSMFFLFFITLALVLSRGHPSAYPVFWAITVALIILLQGDESLAAGLAIAVIVATVLTLLLARCGLLAAAAFQFVSVFDVPLTFDLSRWYSGPSILSVAILVAIAAWAFYVSLGGRPIFRADFLEE